MDNITNKDKKTKDSQLVVFTANYIDVLRIKRGIKAGNIADSHSGAIIGLYALIPAKLMDNKKYKEAS